MSTLDDILERKPDAERPTLTIGDKLFQIPKTPPMGFVVQLERIKRQGFDPAAELPAHMIDTLLRLAVGNDVVEAMYAEAVEMTELPQIMEWVTDQWVQLRQDSGGDGADSGEAPAPSGADR